LLINIDFIQEIDQRRNSRLAKGIRKDTTNAGYDFIHEKEYEFRMLLSWTEM
jgi:hypothetical protein